jgi:hypothetical protein
VTAIKSSRYGFSWNPIHSRNGVKTADELVRKLALATLV